MRVHLAKEFRARPTINKTPYRDYAFTTVERATTAETACTIVAGVNLVLFVGWLFFW